MKIFGATYKVFILAAIAVVIFLYACKKDASLLPPNPDYIQLEKPQFFPNFIPLKDNPISKQVVYLGRRLFYDPILSGDNTQSCASCHIQAYAFTDPRQFSVGIHGKSGIRNSMPLFNLNWHTKGFFWDGRSPSLRDQVLIPIADPTEMASNVTDALKRINNNTHYRRLFYEAFGVKEASANELSKALEQFLTTLVSADAKIDKARRGELGLSFAEMEGQRLFNTENRPDFFERGGDCFHCHSGSVMLFTNNEFFNNGLDIAPKDQGLFNATGKSSDKGLFKAPSLRNLAFTAPYMHDGRFATLDEVLDFYGNDVEMASPNISSLMGHSRPPQIQFTTQEKEYLKAFLNTLNDTAFVTNSAFSNPFK